MSDLITDEMVETATRANYDAMTWPGAWDELDSDLQEGGGERAAMREALEAAAPLIAAKAWEEGFEAGSTWEQNTEIRYPIRPPINPYCAERFERGES